jgi:hypothetical protein
MEEVINSETMKPGRGTASPERIKEAAIRHEGTVYTGRRHADVFKANAVIQNGIIISSIAAGEQGFVTEENRFVDRMEARRIAETAGQMIASHCPRRERLFSEDLY